MSFWSPAEDRERAERVGDLVISPVSAAGSESSLVRIEGIEDISIAPPPSRPAEEDGRPGEGSHPDDDSQQDGEDEEDDEDDEEGEQSQQEQDEEDGSSSGSQESSDDDMSDDQGSQDLAADTAISPSPGSAHTKQQPVIDWKNLEYLQQLPEELFCGICKTPFHRPVTTPCRHVFCFSCLDHFLSLAEIQLRAPCPMCRSMLEFEPRLDGETLAAQVSHLSDRPLIDMLDNTPVRCPNQAGICGWEGPRSLVEAHVRDDCDYTMMRCALRSCPKTVMRGSVRITGDLPNLVLENVALEQGCLHHKAPCVHCFRPVYMARIYDHLNEQCGARPEPQCEACDQRVARRELLAHMEACWQVTVPCRFSGAGCPEAGPRRPVRGHERICLYGMLQKLSERLDERDTAAVAMERDNRRLRQELSRTREGARRMEAKQMFLEQGLEEATQQLAELREELQLAQETWPHAPGVVTTDQLAENNRELERRLNVLAAETCRQTGIQREFVMGETSHLRGEILELRGQTSGTGTLVRWLSLQLQNRLSQSLAEASSGSRPEFSGVGAGASASGGGGGSASTPSPASGSGLRPRAPSNEPRPSL